MNEKGAMNVDFRFCPVCGTYLEKNYADPQSLPGCPLGHFTLYPNLAMLTAAPLLLRSSTRTAPFASAKYEETAVTPVLESDRYERYHTP
jgi:hypothetical protein